jgi:hypothetical protein
MSFSTIDAELTITHSKVLAGFPQSLKIMITTDGGIETDWDRNLVIINQPKQNPPKTWNIDLQRLKEVITCTGILLDETGTDSTTYAYSHVYKERTLRKMCQVAGNVTIQWDTNNADQPLTGNIIKAHVSEIAGTMGDLNDTKYFKVQISFSIGDNKG